VPEDQVEEARWYRKRAGQGNLQAEFNWGALYEIGQGVSSTMRKPLDGIAKSPGAG
jgi:TPR repeat protein